MLNRDSLCHIMISGSFFNYKGIIKYGSTSNDVDE